MKTAPASSSLRRALAGFTLIEMIGVLAIMAMLSAVLVPNVLKAIDSAATKAEVETMRNLGTAIEDYLRQYRVLPAEENPAVVLPTLPNWATQLSNILSVGAYDIATNRRGQRRVYLIDPAAPRRRVIVLSALDNQLVAPNANALPRQTNITSLGFQQIWDTADGSVPPLASWGGWAPWIARGVNGGNYLIIQRVNLAPIYLNELPGYPIGLNNSSASSASYQIISAVSGPGLVVPLASGAHPLPFSLYPRDVLKLFNTAGALNYTYAVSNSPKTFTFDGTNWIIP